ncbi:hypothetical protein FCV66_06860 [Enterovibrio norvegicus]|uniref:hypothetical protein n=1 Tax=Enterovibrio norvegicus TaxID=188144 RepID=UPI000C8273FE|nr:hypothetical protein [Enterovibrio norvegicus]PMI28560.1 hypothetical protein BCU47_21355 [Enterovibrio norvegicus]TKF16543.1 hypothetical protein FCV66_06860 [Enterovibrio norvegicus]
MKSLQELIGSAKEAISSRVSNPFVFGFVISWVLWNVQGVLVFAFSDNAARLAMLQSASFDLQKDLIYPALSTISYLVLMPGANLLYLMISLYFEKAKDALEHRGSMESLVRAKEKNREIIENDLEILKAERLSEVKGWPGRKALYAHEFFELKKKHSEAIYSLQKEHIEYEKVQQSMTDELQKKLNLNHILYEAQKEEIEQLKSDQVAPMKKVDEILKAYDREFFTVKTDDVYEQWANVNTSIGDPDVVLGIRVKLGELSSDPKNTSPTYVPALSPEDMN